MAASASMPPTPQPSTPSPLTIVVWESVPDQGVAVGAPVVGVAKTTRARYSRLTWWQMPVPGGTTRKPSKACWAQRSSW